MKAKYFIICFLLVAGVCWACQFDPVAILTTTGSFNGIRDHSNTYDGSASYDDQGWITEYEWDWTDDASYDYAENSSSFPDGAFDGITTHAYTENGTYTVRLKVTDNTNDTDETTIQVTIQGSITPPDEGGLTKNLMFGSVVR